MKNVFGKHIIRLSVACAAFLLGAVSVWFLGSWQNQKELNDLFRCTMTVEKTPSFVSTTGNKIEGLSKNPFELEKLINKNPGEVYDTKQIWDMFGIDSRMSLLDNYFTNITPDPSTFDSCPSCTAEIHRLNIDNDKEKEVLLTISSAGGFGNFRLLVFDKVGNEWNFVGHTDHDINKYYSPRIRVESFGKDKFLVLTCLGGWGTGIQISFERWYSLEKGNLMEVLSFPNKSEEAMTGGDLHHQSHVRVKKFYSTENKRAFEIEFKNKFSGYPYNDMEKCLPKSREAAPSEISILTSRRIGTYVESDSGKYVLNEGLSTISQKEIESTYIPASVSPADFKLLYVNEVTDVLAEKTSCRSIWLKNWLDRPRE